MPDGDDYVVYPQSVTCAICNDPACTGEHPLGDPWEPDPRVAESPPRYVVPRAEMAPPDFEKKRYPEDG